MSNHPAMDMNARPRIRFDTIGEAWRWLGQQRWPWAGAIVILFIIDVGVMFGANLLFTGSAMGPNYGPDSPRPSGGQIIGGVASQIIQWMVSSGVMGGAYYMGIKHIRGEAVSIGDLFSKLHLIPRIMGASFLMLLAVAAGTILLLIPGLIVAGLFMLTVPLIVDRDLGAVEALRESWNALKHDWLIAAVYPLALLIVSALGALALGIGVIFTFPVFFLGIAGVYRDFFLTPRDRSTLEPLRDAPA